MEIWTIDNKKKCYLMLCELHYPGRHGKTHDSDKNIETHYLVYDRFDPSSGVSYSDLDEYQEYDTDYEYGSDSEDEYNDNRLIRLDDTIEELQNFYSSQEMTIITNWYGNHPTIRNYHNIISKPNYIKPEIGEYIILPTQEAIAILKTFWIRIIQRKWKKIFQERKNIIRQRCSIYNLNIRQIYGKWPQHCIKLPGLKGMLSDLK